MDTLHLQTQMTVEEILRILPETSVVFRNWNTDCIGCLLQKFCSLEDVAQSYEISSEELLGDLQNCVIENIQRPNSKS